MYGSYFFGTASKDAKPWLGGVFVIISELTKSQHNRRRQCIDFRSLKKFYIQSLENKYKVVDLLVQKLLNEMTLDWYPLMNSSLHTTQT